MPKKSVTTVLSFFYIGVLLAVLMPFFLCAPYARQSADDWSYGIEVYNIIKNGGSFFQCIAASFGNVIDAYFTWEGRYFSIFLFAFSPANWKESYYAVVPFILILSQVFGQFLFWFLFLGKKARKFIPFILAPALVMQFLYTGDVSQVYFWYDGGIAYTFEQGLAYFQWGIILMLAFGETDRKYKNTALFALALVFAFLLSGGNYASALSTFCITGLVECVLFFKDRKRFYRILPIFLVCTIGLLISVLAPGNFGRLNANFGGQTNGFLRSILMSLKNTALNIYSWFVYNKGWMIVLMSIPAIILISKELSLKIKHPFVILFLTYGIHSTQMVVNVYIEGNAGGWRNAAILYGSYYMFLIFNALCICTWIMNRKHSGGKVLGMVSKFGLQAGAAVFAIMLLVILVSGDYRRTAACAALRDYMKGYAREYARQWDERFEILRDDSITDPVFHKLTEPKCITLEYADLQLPDEYVWVNEACRQYYGKDSITVIP